MSPYFYCAQCLITWLATNLGHIRCPKCGESRLVFPMDMFRGHAYLSLKPWPKSWPKSDS